MIKKYKYYKSFYYENNYKDQYKNCFISKLRLYFIDFND